MLKNRAGRSLRLKIRVRDSLSDRVTRAFRSQIKSEPARRLAAARFARRQRFGIVAQMRQQRQQQRNAPKPFYIGGEAEAA